MPQPDLTLAKATNEVVRSLNASPTTPVIVHWQVSEFPLRIAKKLVEAGYTVVWAATSMARGDLAQAAFEAAGIATKRQLGRNELVAKATGIATPYVTSSDEPFAPPKIDRQEDEARKATLTEMERVRVWARQQQSADWMDEPPPGTITVLSLSLLNDPKKAAAIAGWQRVVVVVDHPAGHTVQWKNIAKRGRGPKPAEDDFEARVRTKAEDQFQPKILLTRQLPHVYVTRDMWVCVLLRSYLEEHNVRPVELITQFNPLAKLKVTVIASKLAQSRYDGAALLAIGAAIPDAQIVGHAAISGHTPESLSMNGHTPLRRAVLRISAPAEDVFRIMERQGSMTPERYDAIRTRDHIRSAMLGFDSSTHTPELVVLADTKLANIAANFIGATPISLGGWPMSAETKRSAVTGPYSPFVKSVIDVLTQLPKPVLDGRRAARIVGLLRNEPKKVPKLARLAVGLRSLSGGNAPDFAGRTELNIGLSDTGDRALTLFNLLLDATLPWPVSVVLSQHPDLSEAEASQLAEEHRQQRKEIFELYRDWVKAKS